MWGQTVIAPTEYLPEHAIIDGNSLMAISPPIHIQTQVLGVIMSLDSELFELVRCESEFDAEARGKAGEIGLFQYMPSTWKWFNQLRGTSFNIYNSEDQVDMTKWAWKMGFQNHWTCYKD